MEKKAKFCYNKAIMYRILVVLLGIGSATFPELVSAAQINPCPLGTLSCPGYSGDLFLTSIILNAAKVAFGGVLFAMMIFYGFKLIFGADNDSTVTEVYNSYGYALVGTVLAGGALMFADTFAVPGQIVNTDPGNSIVFGVIATLRALLFIAVVFNIFYQGFRLVSSQDESQTDKAKKQFIYGLVGAAIVILSDRFVYAFSGRNYGILNVEAVGIANFLGTILGAFAVIALFVAGLWLVLAVNEQNKDKAKKIIIAAFVVLVITMVSLALIRLTIEAPF